MTISLSTRSTCDECPRPAVLVDRGAFLCEICDARINGEVENSNSDAAAFSRPASIAAAGRSSPQSPAVAPLSASTQSQVAAMIRPTSGPAFDRQPEALAALEARSLGAAFSFPEAGACGFDFDAAISALEAGWRRGG